MQTSRLAPLGALAIILFASACQTDTQPNAPLTPAAAAARHGSPGLVIVASNATAGNSLLLFPRDEDGSLGDAVQVSTGGRGTGAGTGSQGGLALAGDRWLLAVNPGSNDVSVLRRDGNRLTLVDREPSRGENPISVTAWGQLVYVLNAGGEGNIAGFRLNHDGHLSPLRDGIRPLSSTTANPAEVAFSPNGRQLVVSEKGTNRLSIYDVDFGGTIRRQHSYPSSGVTPFGFAFSPLGALLVTEANGGAPDGSALSSYRIGPLGRLLTISGSVATTETSACWVAISPDGRYAYTANTGSATVTGYRIDPLGRLTRLDEDGVTGHTAMGPADVAFAASGRQLFTLDGGAHSLSGFEVNHNGSLSKLETSAAVPAGAFGMVAW